MTGDDLCFTAAVDLARMLQARTLSARELLDAFLDRIHRVNPRLNAIVTLAEEQASVRAKEADDAAARGESLGPLHGLPVAVKDLADTAGIRTTYGSPLRAGCTRRRGRPPAARRTPRTCRPRAWSPSPTSSTTRPAWRSTASSRDRCDRLERHRAAGTVVRAPGRGSPGSHS